MQSLHFPAWAEAATSDRRWEMDTLTTLSRLVHNRRSPQKCPTPGCRPCPPESDRQEQDMRPPQAFQGHLRLVPLAVLPHGIVRHLPVLGRNVLKPTDHRRVRKKPRAGRPQCPRWPVQTAVYGTANERRGIPERQFQFGVCIHVWVSSLPGAQKAGSLIILHPMVVTRLCFPRPRITRGTRRCALRFAAAERCTGQCA